MALFGVQDQWIERQFPATLGATSRGLRSASRETFNPDITEQRGRIGGRWSMVPASKPRRGRELERSGVARLQGRAGRQTQEKE
jgi:hypothetical protein